MSYVLMRAYNAKFSRTFFFIGKDRDSARIDFLTKLHQRRHPNTLVQQHHTAGAAWTITEAGRRDSLEAIESLLAEMVTQHLCARPSHYHHPDVPVYVHVDWKKKCAELTRQVSALEAGIEDLHATNAGLMADVESLSNDLAKSVEPIDESPLSQIASIAAPTGIAQRSEEGEPIAHWNNVAHAALATGNSVRGITKAIETGELKYGFKWVQLG